MINSIIFDFDNTLYDYDICNNSALDKLFISISNDFNIDINIIKQSYNLINKNIKLSNNYSNKFNKIIYIKQLFESLNVSPKFIDKYLDLYNNEFNIFFKLYDNVIELFKFLKNNNIKIGILSNNIFHQQYNKLLISGLLDYIDVIQTTDECGEEKPNINPFLTIIYKLNNVSKTDSQYIAYIGDNFEHDIEPALKLNILPFYFLKNNNKNNFINLNDKYIEFTDYNVLYNFFKEYFKTTNELIFLSKYFGQSNLNVQGPGGNISIKLDDIIFIKSSGSVLGNIAYNDGYCLANNKMCLELLDVKKDLELKNTKIIGHKIPSMETFFHSFMKKYTVHIHFTMANIFFCRNEKYHLRNFPYYYKVIPYIPPGIQLSESIKSFYDDETDIYFLENHGMVITNDNYLKIIEMYEFIYEYFNDLLNNAFDKEYQSFFIQKSIFNNFGKSVVVRNISFPTDILYNIKYCFPDLAIFIEKICITNELSNIDYKANIIIYKNGVFVVGDTLQKCYYIIELLDKYKILCDYSYDNLKIIDDTKYLQNMEQEKFRKI
jgi:putative hydrolase of the HAD superfamily